MATVTVAALAWVVWLRLGPPKFGEPPAVGSVAPPLRLLDVETGEPLVLLGLRGKVVWVVFWSADSPSARGDLARLDRAYRRLRGFSRFMMMAAAVEATEPDRVDAVLAAAKGTPPVYLASPETRRAFGAGELPLHVLIDEEGLVAAVATGMSPDVLSRLGDQAERRLDDLEPLGRARFARADPPHLDIPPNLIDPLDLPSPVVGLSGAGFFRFPPPVAGEGQGGGRRYGFRGLSLHPGLPTRWAEGTKSRDPMAPG
jgi:hypothetical protein